MKKAMLLLSLVGLLLPLTSHAGLGKYASATHPSMATYAPDRGSDKGNNRGKDRNSDNANAQLRVNSSQQAVQLVQSQYQGKVLKVQSSRVNGNPGYRIKMLGNDGVVFYVSVDAQSGRVSRN